MTGTPNAFLLELDHLFIPVQKDAPEAQTLITLGFRHSGQFNRHVGLGTIGTFFFFENAYLELLWVDNEAEYAPTTALLGNPPFGIAFHRQAGSSAPLPFDADAFHWDWMPPDSFLHIAKRDPASREPLFFVEPDSMAYRGNDPHVPSEMRAHPLGVRRLTESRVIITSQELSATARLLSANTNVRVESGRESRLELTFDGETRGKVVDVRPTLPLVIRCYILAVRGLSYSRRRITPPAAASEPCVIVSGHTALQSTGFVIDTALRRESSHGSDHAPTPDLHRRCSCVGCS